MNKPGRDEVEQFRSELSQCQSVVAQNVERLEEDPMAAKQISFWIESARFFLTELEIWEELKSPVRYNETVNKVRNALNHVHQLVVELIEKDYRGYDFYKDVD